jgi:hypothetical protein
MGKIDTKCAAASKYGYNPLDCGEIGLRCHASKFGIGEDVTAVL